MLSILYICLKFDVNIMQKHDDVIKWKHFPRCWPFVRGIHRWPVNSPHKGQWRGVLMFSLICVWINGWENNCEAGDLRRYRAHYDVVVMIMHKTMESMCLSSFLSPFLSSFWQPYSYVVAIDIFWQTHFSIVIFSIKFDGHHPMLILSKTIEFAIVFFSICIAWLINTWRYTYMKYGWNSGQYDEENYGNKVSIVISIVTFDSTCTRIHFAIDIFDRLAFFSIVISGQIIEIISSCLSDRQHLIPKSQSPCYVSLAKHSWIRINIY